MGIICGYSEVHRPSQGLRAKRTQRLIVQTQQSVNVTQQRFTGLRKLDALVTPFKKSLPQLFFQALDLHADSCLRAVQATRCLFKTACLYHGGEGVQ